MRRYVILITSVLVQFCFGSVYAWSVYIPTLRASYGFDATHTQLIFGTAVASFGSMFVFSGILYRKFGARPLLLTGALFYFSGYMLASFSQGVFILIWLGLGLLAGAAVGLAYLPPIVACLHWFPRHKGIISGICVGGFGGGAILVSYLAERQLTAGVDLLMFWRGLGLVYSIIIVCSALFVALPPGAVEEEKRVSVPFRQLIRTREYWGLAIGLFSGTFAGLLIIGSLKPIGIEAGLTSMCATTGVGVFAIGNATGRVISGWIYDLLGKATIPLSLVWISLWVFLLLPSTGWEIAYRIDTALIGAGFGAAFVVYLARAAEVFGKEKVAATYPFVYIAYVISGTSGPFIGGYIRDIALNYRPAVYAAAVIPLIGAVFTYLLMQVGRGGSAAGKQVT